MYFETNQGNYTKSSYIWLYCHYHIGFSTECMYISTKGIFTGGQNAATSICTQRSQDHAETKAITMTKTMTKTKANAKVKVMAKFMALH